MNESRGSDWVGAFRWGFGEGFWYVDPVGEVEWMTEEQLLWAPRARMNCALWQVGHIAHRERIHIGFLLQGRKEEELIPEQFAALGIDVDYAAGPALLEAVGTVDAVKQWVREVRRQSLEYIEGLGEEDWHRVPTSACDGTSVAMVLIQTVGHTGVHIGRIQALRAMMEAD